VSTPYRIIAETPLNIELLLEAMTGIGKTMLTMQLPKIWVHPCGYQISTDLLSF
jgi:hypothetical protein